MYIYTYMCDMSMVHIRLRSTKTKPTAKKRSISVWNRPIIMSGLVLQLRGTPENLMVNPGESMLSITGPYWLLVCIDIPCQKPYCHRTMVEAETLKKEVEHCVATACGKTAAWTQGWPSEPGLSHTPGTNGTTPVAGHRHASRIQVVCGSKSSGILHL